MHNESAINSHISYDKAFHLIGRTLIIFRVKVEDTNAKVEISEDPSATPPTTDNENKEVDIPTLVAELVIEAHKKKMASRAQSRESILRPGSRQSRYD